MKRINRCCTLLIMLGLSTALPAQTTAPAKKTPAPPATPPATEASKPPLPPEKERTLSKSLSSALSAGLTYKPPPAPKPEAEEVDLRDIDKPKNEIIRLPKYVVEAKRPPVFNDRNLYSQEMLRKLAYQRYISPFSRNILNRYHLLGRGDEAYAMMQYEADERKRAMSEMDDKISMYRVFGDNATADQLKDETQNTYMRRSQYSTTPNNKK